MTHLVTLERIGVPFNVLPCLCLCLSFIQVNKERIQDAKGDNELDDGGFYKPTKSTLRAAPSTKTYRLPHVTLAARMEKEILGLWNSRFANAFQLPVPRTIRGYYEKIKNPISLLDIRNRNGESVQSCTGGCFVQRCIALAEFFLCPPFINSHTLNCLY